MFTCTNKEEKLTFPSTWYNWWPLRSKIKLVYSWKLCSTSSICNVVFWKFFNLLTSRNKVAVLMWWLCTGGYWWFTEMFIVYTIQIRYMRIQTHLFFLLYVSTLAWFRTAVCTRGTATSVIVYIPFLFQQTSISLIFLTFCNKLYKYVFCP